ncbi:MAG: O-antigen ligase family protein [Actinobacteria bacterium]|nr:O-antigen ligase family protein [Actinomycetota bacterium]
MTRACFLKNNKVYKIILYVILASPGLFLLVNKYPLLAIASNLVVLLLGVFFLFYRGSITSDHYDILKVLLFIYIYLTLSYFISNQPVENFFSYDFLRYDGSFFFSYILFFALAVPYFDYKEVSKLYFKFLFVIFFLFSLSGIILYLSKNYILMFIDQGASYGNTFKALNNAHNATGSVYAVVCVFLIVFMLKESRWKYRVLYIFTLLMCLACLFLTRSRGSYVSFAVGAVIVIWFHFRSIKKFAISMLVMAAVAAPLVFISGAFKRILMIFKLDEANNAWRLVLWERALYMFRQSPIFGIGFARFNDIDFPSSRLNDFSFEHLHNFTGYPGIVSFFLEPKYDFSTAHAHSSYFQFLAETGIIGMGLVIFFWAFMFKKMFKAYNTVGSSFSKKVFLCCMGGVAVLFTLALTENYFSAATVMMCISMVSSLALGVYWQERNNIAFN